MIETAANLAWQAMAIASAAAYAAGAALCAAHTFFWERSCFRSTAADMRRTRRDPMRPA